MNHRHPTCRAVGAAGLVLAGLTAAASAQDVYKSHAEMLNAAALNKQADAAIIGAMATYDKSQAESAKIHQEIREKAAQNDLLETETYYKKRAQYQAYWETQRAKSTSPGEYAQRARRAAPAQLSSYQVDSDSGALRWPTLFNSAAYDSLRRRIDELLDRRTRDDSGAGSNNSVTALAVVNALKTALRDNVRRYAASDYLVARKFLDAVAREIQRPAGPDAQTIDRVAGR
jgi:hypothetical protein